MTDDDLPFEFAETDAEAAEAAGRPWNILIVDDEQGIHDVTEFGLRRVTFHDRPIVFHHAYSGAEALDKVSTIPDLALIFMDVVMESEEAGLKAIQTLREDMDQRAVRIILRTGQPGMAPERQVILDYDINDYKAKTELTADKLFVATIAALRAYEDLRTIEDLKAMALTTLAHQTGLEQQVLDAVPLAMLHTDPLLAVTGLNAGAADALGLGAEAVLGRSLSALLGRDLASAIETHRGGDLKLVGRAPGGAAVPVIARSFLLADGTHGGFILRLGEGA